MCEARLVIFDGNRVQFDPGQEKQGLYSILEKNIGIVFDKAITCSYPDTSPVILEDGIQLGFLVGYTVVFAKVCERLAFKMK